MAKTSWAPKRAAAMARMPVPVPTSRTVLGGVFLSWKSASTNSRASLVLAWCPVPKAMPGSISITFSPGFGWYDSQVGLITRWAVIGRGLNRSFQALFQSSSGMISVSSRVVPSPGVRSASSARYSAILFSCSWAWGPFST
ncbi:MAG: hypothetical protein ACD_74C00139G0001 [uncultured bacterium]|nr:MAG: hypothetical protein ACD_74C00139G0001 [uncultured bacterium]